MVEPGHPGNIGSVCRACKNTGISDVVIVNPQVSLEHDDIFRFGWASHDIVHGIRVCQSLQEAVEDCQVVVGTSQRIRDSHPPLVTPKELVATVAPQLSATGKVALVFGREHNGLTNEELELCHWVSSIPTATPYPALNLAQAVMVYAYEWFSSSPLYAQNQHPKDLANSKSIESLYAYIETVVTRLPIDTRKGAHAFTNLFRRILGRTFLENRDVRLFFKLFSLFEKESSR